LKVQIMEAADNNEFFESQWRQAFDGASVTPPPMVWERVEARLATQKEGKYRKAIFYYRWAAAAMTTVAVGLGAALWLNGTSSIAEQEVASAAAMEATATEQAQTPELREMKMENEIASSGPSAIEDYQRNGGSKSGTPTLASVAAVSAPSGRPAAEAPLFSEEGENTFETSIAAVTGIFRSEKLISNLSKIEVDHLYGVVRPTQKKRKELGDAPLLAGLGIGSGTFDPNYGFRSGGGLFNNASADETSLIASSTTGAKSNDFNYQNGLAGASTVRGYNESNGQGGTFSFGASVGKRIFRRLLLQTGLQYGRYNSNGTTNLVLNDKSNNKRYALNQTSLANESVQDVFATSQYSYEGEPTRITSTYEFISVPVKLGVILLDRRTGVVLNTGVSNDFLVSNLIKSKDNDIEEVKTKSGDSSPYKKMYVNGTVGLEVNYAINNHYKVVVEPYYRQALTSLTKNADGYSSSPRLWGVQAGVRYELR
jgi:hypothetical protein